MCRKVFPSFRDFVIVSSRLKSEFLQAASLHAGRNAGTRKPVAATTASRIEEDYPLLLRVQAGNTGGGSSGKGRVLAVLAPGALCCVMPWTAHAAAAAAQGAPGALSGWFIIFLAILAVFACLGLLQARRVRQLRRALAESESRYASVVDNMHLGVVILDQQYRIRAMNEVMAQWFPEVDVPKAPYCYEAIEGETTGEAAWYCPTRRALADGRVHRAVVEKRVGDDERLLRIVACPVRDEEGQIVSVVELFDDITEYKRSEVALEEQLDFMQSLLETAPLPIFYKDLHNNFAGCNRAFEELLGVSRKEVLGASEWTFFPDSWAEESMQAEREMLETGKSASYETKLPLLDGSQRDVIVRKAAYEDISGSAAGILTVILDISERKRMEEVLCQVEERYRSIFENAVLGIFRTTVDGRFVEASPSLAHTLGYESPQELMESITDASTQLYANPGRRQEILEDLLEREGMASYENLYKRKDGSLFFGYMNAKLMRDEQGRPLYLDGILEDITERKQAEEQLRHAKMEAERASLMKSDFIAAVTHELRTPLTSVMGFSKMLRKKLEAAVFPAVPKDDAKARKAVGQVRNSLDMLLADAEVLSKLISDVIELARLESGQLEPRLRAEPAYAILKQAVAESREDFARAGLELDLEMSEPLPNVLCDRELILDVLRQLLDNARKFTRQGRVVCSAARDGEMLHLSVRDTGRGIPEEEQQHVFDTFSQLGDTMTEKPKGTGLGLTICSKIVERHGGELLLESTPGIGSTFTFTLHVASDEQQP